MTRVLIVGNSHVAALRLGWDLFDENMRRDVAIEFFAAPGRNFANLRRGPEGAFGLFEPDAVTPQTLSIMRKVHPELMVNLEDYDSILVVGAFFQPNPVLAILARAGADQSETLDSPDLVSAGTFRAKVRRVVANAPFPDFCCDLKRPQVTVLLKPRLTADAAIHEKTDLRALGRAYQLHARMVALRLSEFDFAFLPQPAASLDADGLTQAQYANGSRRLSGIAHPAKDGRHMNRDYGFLCLNEYLDHLPQQAA